MIIRPCALGRALRRLPVAPSSLAACLGGHEAQAAFVRLVRELFPAAADEILAASRPGVSRETARVWAFAEQVTATLFPLAEVEDYDQVMYWIPFVRHGWTYDDFATFQDMRPGTLLLLALCEQPFLDSGESRVALLDAAQAFVSPDLLALLPPAGVPSADLHHRLDGTSYAAAAEFCDWLWSATGSAFLDLSDEIDVVDAEWTPGIVQDLAAQWQQASAILDRITALTTWLEQDPPTHFGCLLQVVLDARQPLSYQQMRRIYACEITAAGIVPLAPEDCFAPTIPVCTSG